jgi:hypothetical protein
MALYGRAKSAQGIGGYLMTMNAAEKAILRERTATLKAGGHDRRTAILRAFELCFPQDYQDCMKLVADEPDREAEFCYFLQRQVYG